MKKQHHTGTTDNVVDILKKRFNQHMQRHPELKWENVQQRLENNQDKLWSLNEMEETTESPM